MKRLILACLMAVMAVGAWAAKAYTLPMMVTQKDGTVLTVVAHGDEHRHWFTTSDGTLLVRSGHDFYVAQIQSDGELAATAQLAHESGRRSAQEQQLVMRQDKNRFFAALKAATVEPRKVPVGTTSRYFPHQGTPCAVVILVEFSDSTFSLPDPKKSFDFYLNGTGSRDDAAFQNGESALQQSVADYFDAVSFGQYKPRFDIYGPVKIDKPVSYFKQTSNSSELLKTACTLMDGAIDFADPKYDSDGDGYVDAVCIMYASYSSSITRNSSDLIWPHATAVSGFELDGVKLGRYCVINELNAYPNAYSAAPKKRINGTGLFCHEFSHVMGLPDLYPTITSSRDDNQAMEYWSLMDGGEYLANGNAPTAYTAWEREAMGWLTIETLDHTQDVEALKSLDEGGKAYRILNDNDATGREGYVLENIQQTAVNARQYGHGLLVYHVNYLRSEVNMGDAPNNTLGRPQLSVVPADSLLLTSSHVGKEEYINPLTHLPYTSREYYNHHAGDAFPGTSRKVSLTDADAGFVPNWQPYSGEKLNKALLHIAEDTEALTVSFRYVHDAASDPSGIRMVRTTAAASRIYNLLGRDVGNNPSVLPRGVYVTGGKKVVIR